MTQQKTFCPDPWKSTEENLAAHESYLKRRLRSGSYWRTSAWDDLMKLLREYSAGMREGGPLAIAMYAQTLTGVVDYLGRKPDKDRFADVYYMTGVDLSDLVHHLDQMRPEKMREAVGAMTCIMLGFDCYCHSDEDQVLTRNAVQSCLANRAMLEQCCPSNT